MNGAGTTYAILIALALLVNGLAVAGTTPLRELLAPLRDRRLLIGAVAIDVLVVPAALLIPARLLDLPVGIVAGLAVLAAASTGPVGVALARIGCGDVPVAVALVTALGAANVVTVPLLMAVLIPSAFGVPFVAILQSLLLLLALPLAAGVALRRAQERRGRHPEAIAGTARRLGAVSTALLLAALVAAAAIDPRGVLADLASPVLLVGPVALLTVGAAARMLTADPARWRALWLTLTARSVGVALAVVGLHLRDVDGALAAVLAVGGLMQIVPVVTLVGMDRRRRPAARATR